MDSATLAQTLSEAIFDPIVLGGAALVTLALLSGVVARFAEMLERRDLAVGRSQERAR